MMECSYNHYVAVLPGMTGTESQQRQQTLHIIGECNTQIVTSLKGNLTLALFSLRDNQ